MLFVLQFVFIIDILFCFWLLFIFIVLVFFMMFLVFCVWFCLLNLFSLFFIVFFVLVVDICYSSLCLWLLLFCVRCPWSCRGGFLLLHSGHRARLPPSLRSINHPLLLLFIVSVHCSWTCSLFLLLFFEHQKKKDKNKNNEQIIIRNNKPPEQQPQI